MLNTSNINAHMHSSMFQNMTIGTSNISGTFNPLTSYPFNRQSAMLSSQPPFIPMTSTFIPMTSSQFNHFQPTTAVRPFTEDFLLTPVKIEGLTNPNEVIPHAEDDKMEKKLLARQLEREAEQKRKQILKQDQLHKMLLASSHKLDILNTASIPQLPDQARGPLEGIRQKLLPMQLQKMAEVSKQHVNIFKGIPNQFTVKSETNYVPGPSQYQYSLKFQQTLRQMNRKHSRPIKPNVPNFHEPPAVKDLSLYQIEEKLSTLNDDSLKLMKEKHTADVIPHPLATIFPKKKSESMSESENNHMPCANFLVLKLQTNKVDKNDLTPAARQYLENPFLKWRYEYTIVDGVEVKKRDDNGNYIRYLETTTLVDEFGNPILDGQGNKQAVPLEVGSCHSCKKKKAPHMFWLCDNMQRQSSRSEKKRRRGPTQCRNKYCIDCLKRSYTHYEDTNWQKHSLFDDKGKFIERPESFVCMSCSNWCTCKKCLESNDLYNPKGKIKEIIPVYDAEGNQLTRSRKFNMMVPKNHDQRKAFKRALYNSNSANLVQSTNSNNSNLSVMTKEIQIRHKRTPVSKKPNNNNNNNNNNGNSAAMTQLIIAAGGVNTTSCKKRKSVKNLDDESDHSDSNGEDSESEWGSSASESENNEIQEKDDDMDIANYGTSKIYNPNDPVSSPMIANPNTFNPSILATPNPSLPFFLNSSAPGMNAPMLTAGIFNRFNNQPIHTSLPCNNNNNNNNQMRETQINTSLLPSLNNNNKSENFVPFTATLVHKAAEHAMNM